MKENIKVSCTWGDGPDVLLSLEGKCLMLHEHPIDYNKSTHGFISKGSIDLTAKEALDLAQTLINAAKQALDLDIAIRNQLLNKENMQ